MKEQKKDYPKSGRQFEDDYEELNITNRFMFNKVMSNAKLCSRVLQSLTGKNVSEVKSLVAEKYLQITEDGRGVRCYDFSNRSGKKGELPFGDKRTILIYNVMGKSDELNEDTNEFLDYVKDGTVGGTLSDSLDKAVKDARHNKEWRSEYMMHMANYWDNIDEGKEIGIEIGKEIGKEIERANSLVNYVDKCMNNTRISLEEALDILGETMDDYLKAKEILEENEILV